MLRAFGALTSWPMTLTTYDPTAHMLVHGYLMITKSLFHIPRPYCAIKCVMCILLNSDFLSVYCHEGHNFIFITTSSQYKERTRDTCSCVIYNSCYFHFKATIILFLASSTQDLAALLIRWEVYSSLLFFPFTPLVLPRWSSLYIYLTYWWTHFLCQVLF